MLENILTSEANFVDHRIVMSLQPYRINPVPVSTSQVAQAAFPKGNLYLTMRDEIGTFYSDYDFETLFPNDGQPAVTPWRLALICVMQFIEGLSERQAFLLRFAVVLTGNMLCRWS